MRSNEKTELFFAISHTNKPFLIAVWWLACVIGRAGGAETPFAPSDFLFQIEAQRTTFRPGEVVVFDGILTNLSSVTAEFDVDLALVGSSWGPEIDGVFVLAYPFIEGVQTASFRNERLLPGGKLRFPFLSIDTGTSTPLGTAISSGNANLLFQNIPPTTPDLVDFFVSASNVASAIAVPEPEGDLLLFVGVTGLVIASRCRCLRLT
jgi:hypothetical protein